jgi:hypothetical protein
MMKLAIQSNRASLQFLPQVDFSAILFFKSSPEHSPEMVYSIAISSVGDISIAYYSSGSVYFWSCMQNFQNCASIVNLGTVNTRAACHELR